MNPAPYIILRRNAWALRMSGRIGEAQVLEERAEKYPHDADTEALCDDLAVTCKSVADWLIPESKPKEERRPTMPVQAIQTKYLCPTNFKGSRYKAWCQRGSITVSADDRLNSEQNHLAVAAALKVKFEAEDFARYGAGDSKNPWARPTVMGWLGDGSACHVYLEA